MFRRAHRSTFQTYGLQLVLMCAEVMSVYFVCLSSAALFAAAPAKIDVSYGDGIGRTCQEQFGPRPSVCHETME